MPGHQIPDIFHQFQGWMEVRDEVMELICNGLYEIKFSSESTTTSSESEATASDAIKFSSEPTTTSSESEATASDAMHFSHAPTSPFSESATASTLEFSCVPSTSSSEISEATISDAMNAPVPSTSTSEIGMNGASVPSTSTSEIGEATTSSFVPPESSASKRKTEEEFQASKKMKTDVEPEETESEDNSPYLNVKRVMKLLKSQDNPEEKYLAEKQAAKLKIFEEFFEKRGVSHPPEELECETDENVIDKLGVNIILEVLKENKEPALEEWIKAIKENDVGPIEGSSSKNYRIFNNDEFGNDLSVPLNDLMQPSTPPQLNKSFDLFSDSEVQESLVQSSKALHWLDAFQSDDDDPSLYEPYTSYGVHEEILSDEEDGSLYEPTTSYSVHEEILSSDEDPSLYEPSTSGIHKRTLSDEEYPCLYQPSTSYSIHKEILSDDKDPNLDDADPYIYEFPTFYGMHKKTSDYFLPDSQIISGRISPDIEVISDSDVTNDDRDVSDNGLKPDSEMVPDSRETLNSEVNSGSEEDDQPDDELDIFSFLSNPFRDQFVPDGIEESDSEKCLTSASRTLSDISVYESSRILENSRISDSQQPPSSSVDQDIPEDDEYGIDFNELSKFGLRPLQKYLTKTVVRSNDDDRNLYEPSTSYDIHEETFAERIQDDPTVEREKLCSYTEILISSDSEDQTDNQQTFSVTKDSEIPSEKNVNKNIDFSRSSCLRYILQNSGEKPIFCHPEGKKGASFCETVKNPSKVSEQEMSKQRSEQEMSKQTSEQAIVNISPPYQDQDSDFRGAPEPLIVNISPPYQNPDFQGAHEQPIVNISQDPDYWDFEDHQPDLI